MPEPFGIVARGNEQGGGDFWSDPWSLEQRRRALLDETLQVGIQQPNLFIQPPPPLCQAAEDAACHLLQCGTGVTRTLMTKLLGALHNGPIAARAASTRRSP